jgi:hypothetical protein
MSEPGPELSGPVARGDDPADDTCFTEHERETLCVVRELRERSEELIRRSRALYAPELFLRSFPPSLDVSSPPPPSPSAN